MSQLTQNNIATNIGDIIQIKFTVPYENVQSVSKFSDLIIGETPNRFFIKHFRWAKDAATVTNQTFSAWITLTEANITTIPFIVGDTLWFEFKYERGGTDDTGVLEIEEIDLTVLSVDHNKTYETPPSSITSCPGANSCAGIIAACDSELWDPYSQAMNAICILDQMNCAVADIWGHCVWYFKTTADPDSKDAILKEYSLYNVIDKKQIKIMVPDNEFPDNAIQYNMYDPDFEAPFEIQIVRSHFERAFGQNKRPEERDFLYFPLMDRIWEVHSAYLFKDFMQNGSYYKVSLYKWQDKVNVDKGDFSEELDDMTLNFEEVLKNDVENEYIRVTKPQIFNTTSIGAYDHVRNLINNDLTIKEYDLNNYYTVVGKYFYELPEITKGQIAVEYKQPVNVYGDGASTNDITFTCWFTPQKKNWSSGNTDRIFGGASGATGFNIDVQYNLINRNIEGMNIWVNGTQYTFHDQAFTTLRKDIWYALIVNLDNTHSQLTVYLWSMKPNSEKTTILNLLYTGTENITPKRMYIPGMNFCLYGCDLYITGIRLFKHPIEEEVQPKILNQYIVKDHHYALIVDNVIPPLRLPRVAIR